MNEIIAGALFDFAAYLTTRNETLVLGSGHDAAPIVQALEEWAEDREFDLTDADVTHWQTQV